MNKRTRKLLKELQKRGLKIPDTRNWKYAHPHAMWKSDLARMQGRLDTTDFFKKNVHGNPELMERLTETGYVKSSKWLTQKQVDLICDVVGYLIVSEKDSD